MDACRTFRSIQHAGGSRMWNVRATALLAAFILALTACAMHPRPQSPPPPPLPTKRARSVPPPQTHSRVAPAPSPSPNSGDALAPADVGYYMDVLQGRLKQVVGKGIGVARQGDRIVIDLTSRMAFSPGSAQLGAGDRAILAPLSKVLMEYRMTLVSVRVRAADPATHAIDPHLSAQRAQAIANDLTQAGVGLKRIVIAGVGAENRAHVFLSLEPIVSPAGNGR
jgi:outer membrane protein OmpA-like peptidoglycan-associated protein